MRRILVCLAIGMLTVAAYAQWVTDADVPAYHATAPAHGTKLSPLRIAHNFSHLLRFNNGLLHSAGRIEVVLKLNRLWLRKPKLRKSCRPNELRRSAKRIEPEWALRRKSI